MGMIPLPISTLRLRQDKGKLLQRVISEGQELWLWLGWKMTRLKVKAKSTLPWER